MTHGTRIYGAAFGLALTGPWALAGCTNTSDGAGRGRAALVAECTEGATTLDGDAWVCPDALTVECDGGDGTADPGTIYYEDSGAMTSCDDVDVVASDEGPFSVGTHTVEVLDGEGGPSLCSAELTVEDTVAPEVESHELELWPPNHELVAIDPDDCATVTDACDGDDLDVTFTRVTSDEPVNDRGDGNTEPDVVFGECGELYLRAERDGRSNGRVYTVDFTVADGEGNETTGSCTVSVPHDRRGDAAVDDGPAYEVLPPEDDDDDDGDDEDDGDDDDCDDDDADDDDCDDDDCDGDDDCDDDDADDCDDDDADDDDGCDDDDADDDDDDDDDDCDDDEDDHPRRRGPPDPLPTP